MIDIEKEDTILRNKFLYYYAIFISLFHIYCNAFFAMDPLLLRASTLYLGLIFAFFNYFLKEKYISFKIIWAIFIILSLVSWVYMAFEYDSIIHRSGGLPTYMDYICGTFTIISIYIITIKSIGVPLFIFGVIMFLYPLFGSNLPSILSHTGFNYRQLLNYIYSIDGIFSMIFSVVPTYLMVFLIFGGFLQVTGTGEFFIDLSLALTGKVRGGPAKVAIIASALFGTLSGSTMSNVITTGTFTIPMMKRVGFEAHYAGGVEAAASSGGQIMPPVMGAVAFLMVELTGIPYVQIIKAAIIPALLYYLSLFVMVDAYAAKKKLCSLDKKSLRDIKEVFLSGWHLLTPIGILLVSLIYFKHSPIRAGLLATAACIPASWIKRETRINIKKFFDALEIGGNGLVSVIAPVGLASMITAIFSLTGLGVKLGNLLLTYTRGNLFLTLVVVAIFSIILGMGQPGSSAYVVVAVITVPGLLKLGIPLLRAHMFALYFVVFSNLTPPIAMGSYVAASIGKADPVKTSLSGFRLSLSAFIVPFLFIYQPEIMLFGPILPIFREILFASLGIVGLAIAIEGYYLEKLNLFERTYLIFFSIGCILPEYVSSIIGFVMIAIFLLFFKKYRKLRKTL